MKSIILRSLVGILIINSLFAKDDLERFWGVSITQRDLSPKISLAMSGSMPMEIISVIAGRMGKDLTISEAARKELSVITSMEGVLVGDNWEAIFSRFFSVLEGKRPRSSSKFIYYIKKETLHDFHSPEPTKKEVDVIYVALKKADNNEEPSSSPKSN